MNNNRISFTIIAQNYVSYAITIGLSLRESNPNLPFVIYFTDGLSPALQTLLASYNIEGRDLLAYDTDGIYLDMAFYYNVTEYCTAVKPFVFHELFKEGYEKVVYLDPDIYVYTDLSTTVFDMLETNSILLTPHICSPIHDDALPNETVHLKTGSFNLGFIAIKNNTPGQQMVMWWMDKCLHSCFDDAYSGLFVDQKWINLAPCLFENVFISRNPGLNIAYWNLHERKIVEGKVNDQYDMVFFHYSGLVTSDLNCISKYQNRYTLLERPDLAPYFEHYKQTLEAVSSSLEQLPSYRFATYSSGQTISLLARRFYFWNRESLQNPLKGIADEAAFLASLKANGIVEEKTNSAVLTTDAINTKARILNRILRIVLRFVGPNRYASLCRYFGYVSSLQNNKFLMSSHTEMDVVDTSRHHIKRQ